MILITVIKRIATVVSQKSWNNELQESFVPMLPRQLTQGEFQLEMLKSLIEKQRTGDSVLEDSKLWEELIMWLHDSYFFPEKHEDYQQELNYYEKYKVTMRTIQ